MSSSAQSLSSSGSSSSTMTKLPNASLNFAASSTSSSSTQAPFNFAPLITTRLGPENYLYWRAQVAPILRSHLLTGFIDGTFPCPSEFIDNPKASDDATAPRRVHNPSFTAWHQQDSALLSAIIATSTEVVQGMILFAASALDAWTTLEARFSSQSTARGMQICRALFEVKKLDSSVTAYFNKVKSMSDTLTSIGQPLSQEQFISYLLAGLDDDYDALVEVVSARTTPMPLHDLYAQMLSTEQRVERRKTVLHHGGFPSANASFRGQGKPPQYRQDFRSGPDPRNVPRPNYINKQAGGAPGSAGFSNSNGGSRQGDRPDYRSGGAGDRPGFDRGVRPSTGGGGRNPSGVPDM
jgi:hypothetical protein